MKVLSLKRILSSVDFEKKILGPIKPLDELLKKIPTGKFDVSELKQYYELMQDHSLLGIAS